MLRVDGVKGPVAILLRNAGSSPRAIFSIVVGSGISPVDAR
jgi:hypothetical protein